MSETKNGILSLFPGVCHRVFVVRSLIHESVGTFHFYSQNFLNLFISLYSMYELFLLSIFYIFIMYSVIPRSSIHIFMLSEEKHRTVIASGMRLVPRQELGSTDLYYRSAALDSSARTLCE